MNHTLTLHSIKDRNSKIDVKDFASGAQSGCILADFMDRLPNILVGKDFRSLADAIVKARDNYRPVIVMMGGHVIKCGLAPVIISLMDRGVITSIAMNGAAAIHDYEISMWGTTSEDVDANIKDGTFGMWAETGAMMNTVLTHDHGLGSTWSQSATYGQHDEYSILAAAFKCGVGITAHVSIGCDIIHMHPSANGSIIGSAAMIDFHEFVDTVAELQGGVIINLGSAVVMPEVFLKAISMARNMGHEVSYFTAANFDIIDQYRARKNVVGRPTTLGGVGYNFIGHHEIMIPLLAYSIMDKMG